MRRRVQPSAALEQMLLEDASCGADVFAVENPPPPPPTYGPPLTIPRWDEPEPLVATQPELVTEDHERRPAKPRRTPRLALARELIANITRPVPPPAPATGPLERPQLPAPEWENEKR